MQEDNNKVETITKTENEIKKEECSELKTIKYKTMIMQGKPIIQNTSTTNDMTNLDKYLEREKNINKNEPWSKLDKTNKTKKLMEFANKYINDKNLNENDAKLLIGFLKDCLDKKRIGRVKDVVYDKNTGIIKDIPALLFNKQTKNFTLKQLDKHVSTLKSLGNKKNISNKNKEDVNEVIISETNK